MLAYRFRILYDEQEDFLRDIEIKPGQTFKNFHDCILKSTNLEGNELASFFICDQSWNKQKEITLIDMGLNSSDPADATDDEKPIITPIPLSIMENVKIKEAIEDPHQRILFEFDFLNPRTFFIELTKILDADPKKDYPVCVKSEGTLSAASSTQYFSYLDDPDEIALLDEVDKMIQDGDLDETVDENFTTEPEW